MANASAILRDPPVQGQADYLHSLAAAHASTGELDLAWDVALKAVQPQAFPTHLPCLLLAGRVSARLGESASRLAEGVALGERAVNACREGGEEGKQQLREAYHVLGVNLLLQARTECSPEERAELLARARDALSSATDGGKGPKGALVDLALALAESSRLEEALGAAKLALQGGGQSLPATWQVLALLLASLQRPGDAVEMCRLGVKAVGGWPGSARLQELLGRLHKDSGSFGEAAGAFKELLKQVQLHKGEAQSHGCSEQRVWILLASVYTEAKKFSDAASCLARAEGEDSSAEYWAAVGSLHQNRGDMAAAVKAYDRAVAIGESDVLSKVELAGCLLHIGGSSVQLAKAHLNEALATDPLECRAWFNMGLVSQAEGDMINAAKCFHRSRVLGDMQPPVPFCSVLPTLCDGDQS